MMHSRQELTVQLFNIADALSALLVPSGLDPDETVPQAARTAINVAANRLRDLSKEIMAVDAETPKADLQAVVTILRLVAAHDATAGIVAQSIWEAIRLLGAKP